MIMSTKAGIKDVGAGSSTPGMLECGGGPDADPDTDSDADHQHGQDNHVAAPAAAVQPQDRTDRIATRTRERYAAIRALLAEGVGIATRNMQVRCD
ncbi:hypothetical protein GCM10022205_27260 [Spinactinospora alkalitolerans]